jgi:hypothetical protein
MNRIALAVASLGLALVACRGDDGPNGDDTMMIDAPAVVGEVTIQEIQDAAMPVGTVVEVKGVVVTVIDSYGNRTGDLWVQEPGGGEFSGIKVFGAPLDQIAALAPGDLVDITGAVKDEFALTSDTSGNKVTELKPVEGGMMTITKVGTGTVPAPATVDAKAIAAKATAAERDAEWEKWEGVLIKVTNARQIADVRTFGSNPGPDSNEFRATGFVRVQSALVALPTTAAFGVCYDSITGVGDYFFNWILAPRSDADFVAGGTSCNTMATTVAMVQSGTNVEVVDLTNVIVTARDDIGMTSKGFWVADAAQGAANNGVLVFTGSTAPDAGLVIGARVASIRGSVDEFDLGSMGAAPMGDTITEITNPVLPFMITAPTGQLPQPATTPTVATLATIGAAGEPWEGVLVRIGPVKVTMASAGQGKIELSDNSVPAVKIHIDDDAFQFPTTPTPTAPPMGACIQVTGIMSVAIFDDLRTINPRSLADVVTLNANMCN